VIYGTTCDGGRYYSGIAFSLAQISSKWTFTVLYNFDGGPHGGCPASALAKGKNGNLIGTTYYGGDPNCACGTVYELSHGASGWTETVLHKFLGSPNDGASPEMAVVSDAKGNLFGATQEGGTNEDGTVYKIPIASGGKYGAEIVLGSQGNETTGYQPDGDRLAIDKNGNLYGTAENGGTNDAGMVFEAVNSAGSYSLTAF